MIFQTVTITGADDSISPAELLPLSREFPFVEWGILASASNTGAPRFPSLAWMDAFRAMSIDNRLNASLHLCGRWVRMFLVGDLDPLVPLLANGFARIQLNFHAERNKCEPAAALRAMDNLRCRSLFGAGLKFIFQLDGERGNDHLESIAIEEANAYGTCNCLGLFDVSGGAGILPGKWPKPLYHEDGKFDSHGYAGGLGPDNLAEQIPLIAAAAGDIPFWIDMETHVRSDDDTLFDLAKVRRCLEIASHFVIGDVK
jgi:hypothetical protein